MTPVFTRELPLTLVCLLTRMNHPLKLLSSTTLILSACLCLKFSQWSLSFRVSSHSPTSGAFYVLHPSHFPIVALTVRMIQLFIT